MNKTLSFIAPKKTLKKNFTFVFAYG